MKHVKNTAKKRSLNLCFLLKISRTYEDEVPTPSSENEKTIVVDECLIDVIKTMNGQLFW